MIETRDTGVLPEPILRREARAAGSEWAIFHPSREGAAAADRYEAILDAAWNVSDQPLDSPWDDWLASPKPAIRFWTVHAMAWQTRCDGPVPADLVIARLGQVLDDPDPVIQIVAASWVLKIGGGPPNAALDVLGRGMRSDDPDIRQQALVAIDQLGDRSRPLWAAAAAIEVGNAHKADEYSRRMIERIRTRLAASGNAPVGSLPQAPTSSGSP
jgi:hypothetical protein